jgi:GntR family transcriptional regulator
MIPFTVVLRPGTSICDQVVYAAKKAIVAGQMKPGDPFPSVREISKALKINPNTAHKVVSQLIAEELLEVHPGLGTVVARRFASSAAERTMLLKNDLEQLVVEAKRLGLPLHQVADALAEHWARLEEPLEMVRRKS